MQQQAVVPTRGQRAAGTHFTSHMHGERTKVEIFTRVPDAAFHSVEIGQMGLIALRCGTIAMRRDPADIRARPNRILTFILQGRGRSAFSHYGNQIVLDEGDITLCNNSMQYDLSLDGPNELIMFRVPAPLVHSAIPSTDYLFGRRLAGDQGLASMAVAMARDLTAREPGRLACEQGERAGRHLLEVLASSYVPLLDQRSSGSAVMAGRFSRVKLFIEEHLRDPALRPALVASGMGLSDRYLRMIFATGDESPSAYILRRRLEKCAAQLRDPRWHHHSITSIAFSWGFNSAPHFARSFRAQFCCSPSDYRHQQPS